jgi:small ligand-binding sensory domain FIST
MKWASAISTFADAASAAQDVLRQLRDGLGGGRPDFLFLFVSPAHGASFASLVETVELGLHARQWGAVTARGVAGSGREVESGPCVSAMAAYLPDVSVEGRHLNPAQLPDSDAPPGAWLRLLGLEPEPRPNFLVFADPFGDPEPLLQGLDYAFAGCPVVGGLLSGADRAGQNRLVWNGRVFSGGALLLAFSGNIAFDPVVAQGCRPVGPEMLVTSTGGPNLVTGLDGVMPMAMLERLDQSLPAADKVLLRQALFLGVVVGETPEGHVHLIRNVLDIDHNRGGLWVGSRVEPGMRVRFHVRDRSTSREDLDRLLMRYFASRGASPEAVLYFGCLGRGRHLYGVENHDAALIAYRLGAAPHAGFFCAGEIGPVAGQTVLHGYTAALALVRALVP